MSETDQVEGEAWETAGLPPLVDVPTAAAILGVSKGTLYRWINDGYMVAAAMAGDKPVWVRADVERFAREHGRVRAPAGQPSAATGGNACSVTASAS